MLLSNPCVRTSSRTKISFFSLSMFTEAFKTQKITAFLSRSKSGNKKIKSANEQESNPVPYPR